MKSSKEKKNNLKEAEMFKENRKENIEIYTSMRDEVEQFSSTLRS